MTINIALSTIIYIMVFLFPGIIFRKSFFSGNFSEKFESGNQLERFLWSILASIFCIVTFTITHSYINEFLDNEISFDLKPHQILETFICLYENRFPPIFTSQLDIISLIKVILSLYFFSFILGKLFYYTLTIYKLDKTFNTFNFSPSWDNIIISSKTNNISHKTGDITLTNLDIKTKNGDLFTGRYYKIFYNKEGQIKNITLHKTYKFYRIDKTNPENNKLIKHIKYKTKKEDPYFIYHSQNNFEYVYKKRIKGDLFTIDYDQVENISITFIKLDNVYEKILNDLAKVGIFLMMLISGILFTYTFWDYEIINFSEPHKRWMFGIVSSILILVISKIIISSVKMIKGIKYIPFIQDIHMLLLYSFIMLYVFDIFNLWYLIGAITILMISFAFFTKKQTTP